MDDPDIKAYVAALPFDVRESIRLEVLKLSVSKCIDRIDQADYSDIDALFVDIDELSINKAMMPGEAQNLKAYLLNVI